MESNGKQIVNTNKGELKMTIEFGSMDERIEQLYVSPEYKVFLLTGQPGSGFESGRRAYISIKPFNTITDASTLFNMTAQAKPLDMNSCITLENGWESLTAHDQLTCTNSSIPISELDPIIQERLRSTTADPFAKYAAPKAP